MTSNTVGGRESDQAAVETGVPGPCLRARHAAHAAIPEGFLTASRSRSFSASSVDAFGLFGDEHVGVEQLAEELDEELAGVGEGGHGRAPFERAPVRGGHPVSGMTAPSGCQPALRR
jgi:hypothetical protein